MGTTTKTGSLSGHAVSHDTTNYSYASVSSSYPLSNAYAESSNTSYAQVSWKTGASAETYVYLRFDLSAIPANATITSVSASAKGYVNTTNSSRVTTRQMQLCSGTTLKGSALTISTSTSAQTFSNTGSWTRAEIENAGVRFYVQRGTSNTTSTYQLRIYGASITVGYSYQETTYEITVTNNSSVTVAPASQEVAAGSSASIRADSIDGLTVTDNGTDVTSQFTRVTETAESYSVAQASGTSYGFELNGSGYYESNNKGRSSSTALCVVSFHMPIDGTVTFSLINYAESTYDFGLLGEIDKTLSTSASADSSNVHWSGKNNNSASVQTVTYSMPAGDHEVYVKYFKDNYTDDNNDSLQFKVAISLDEPFTPGTFYKYVIANVQEAHEIIVSSEKLYVRESGAWVAYSKAWKKVNGTWVEQGSLSSVFQSGVNYVRGV